MATKSKMILAKTKYRYTIYGLQNTVTNKWYIGITRQFDIRKSQHLQSLNRGDHHSSKLQNSFNKHGVAVWGWHILDTRRMTWQKMKSVEREWIALFDSYRNGYNMTEGGDSPFPNRTKICQWEGVTYPSIAEAARSTGIHPDALRSRINKGYVSETEMVGRGKKDGNACIWNNKHYLSISHAARDNGYAPETFRDYLAKGCTSDGDVEYYLQNSKYPKPQPVIWNGVKYPSINQAAKANGIDANTMKYRLEQGYACDSDMDKPCRACAWNGVEYPSIAEASRATGIDQAALYARLQRGYKSESDMVGSGGHNHQKSCIWNGVEYQSIKHAAIAIGVKPATLSVRISRGYTCDEDFRPSRREVIWNGVTYPTMKEAALAIGIDAATLTERLDKGYTKDSDVRKAKTCVWNGVEYCSVQEAAKALGISDTLMYRRINRGFAQDSDLLAGSKGARVND